MIKKIILLVIVVALIAAADAAVIPYINPGAEIPQVATPMVSSSQNALVYASSAVVSDSATTHHGTGNINITSTPSGAQVWLDRHNISKITPVNLTSISAGYHIISLKLSGYKTYSSTVRVTSGKTTNVDATLVAAEVRGNISVNSTPPGARIWIDNVNTGKRTPSIIPRMKPGSHTVKLKLSGYSVYSTTVVVTGGETSRVDADLTALTGNGTISLKSNPTAAKIFLDGVDTGKITPALLTAITPGKHSVSLMITANVTVKAEKKTTVVGTLSYKN